MRLIVKQELTVEEATVAGSALDALASMRLDKDARWRVQQLEAMLCEKESDPVVAALDEP